MPQPTASTTIQRADLGMVAYEYMLEASQRGFIASKIFPIFDVAEQSADYPIIPIEALLKAQDVNRGAKGNYNRSDYEWETGTYSAKEYGWEERVEDSERTITSRFFDLDAVATKRAVDILLREYEKRVAAKVFNTSNVTNTANVGTEWSTAASATPYTDVNGAKASLKAATGIMPNKIAMSWKVFNNVLLTAEFKDAFKYTAPTEKLSMEGKLNLLTQYFGVDEVLVSDAQKDAAKKGQSYSLSYLWDDEYVLLFRGHDSMDLKDPQLGRSFLYTADSPNMVTTEQYREEQTRSDVFRVRHYLAEDFVFTGAGYLLGNITA